MRLTFDPAKQKTNLAKHRLDFAMVETLEWELAIALEDTRKDYREYRYRFLVPQADALYSVVGTWRNGALRIISFRKAGAKERKYYAEEKDNKDTHP